MGLAAQDLSRRVRFAVIGNPNTGKTTLFNALTGMRQHIGNYPGVTVEQKVGSCQIGDSTIELIDLPGTYSLAAQSPDEMVAVDLLLNQQEGAQPIDGVIVIVDATNLRRNFYLLSQILECGIPTLLVVNMVDVAREKGLQIDLAQLGSQLGIPVIATAARHREGIDDVRDALTTLAAHTPPSRDPLPQFPAAMEESIATLCAETALSRVEGMRALVDYDGAAQDRLFVHHPQMVARLAQLRDRAGSGSTLSSLEASHRYQWIRGVLQRAVVAPSRGARRWTDRIDAVLTHKFWGTGIFAAVTILIFQAIYQWSGPIMDLIDTLFGTASGIAATWLPEGPLQSLVVDGIIGGVGSVVIFLPQILVLFLFIAIMEECGYMARAAFLMDRLLARLGLSGRSFIPLLSSFACAIPGIMATRTIQNRRDRLVTIMVAPLMSCSARLPVYTILIAAFIPATIVGGWLNLQGLILFGMHLVGVVVAIPIIWILKRTILKSSTPSFVMELPPYRLPSLRLIAHRIFDRGKAFLRRAGTIIFAMSIIVWFFSYFPHPAEIGASFAAQRATVTDTVQLQALAQQEAGAYLEASYLGRVGHAIEPMVKPLGWDWRIGTAALASFPAREVIVAVLGTLYNLGDAVDASSVSLVEALTAASWPDGSRVFNIPVALSVMIFFALCCQCGATVAMIRRETNSWGYAWFTFGYMTALAYVGAWITYRVGMLF
jgi:ferrous iron transport protein B